MRLQSAADDVCVTKEKKLAGIVSPLVKLPSWKRETERQRDRGEKVLCAACTCKLKDPKADPQKHSPGKTLHADTLYATDIRNQLSPDGQYASTVVSSLWECPEPFTPNPPK